MSKERQVPTLSDYIDKLGNNGHLTTSDRLELILDFNTFWRTPLTLGMFLPCDKEGNLLEKPKRFDSQFDWNNFVKGDSPQWYKQNVKYQKALNKIIFTNYTYDELKDGLVLAQIATNTTIGEFVEQGNTLTLTPQKAKDLNIN
jgi:hypothetical protein